MQIAPPENIDYGFYNGYVYKVKNTDLVTALKENWNQIKSLADSLTTDQWNHTYAPGKWTIKDIFVHLVDSERNFPYRIMRFSRGASEVLPLFNIHDFIVNAHTEHRSVSGILQELELLRKASILMFEEMHPDMLDKAGPARDITISVRALGFAICGHAIHHMDSITEKYLKR